MRSLPADGRGGRLGGGPGPGAADVLVHHPRNLVRMVVVGLLASLLSASLVALPTARSAGQLSTAAAATPSVLVVGDSLAHQSADEIREAFAARGFTDVELAVFGGTTIGWAADRILERPSHDIVVLGSGTYNMLGGWTEADAAEARRAVAVLDQRACSIWLVPAELSSRQGVRLALAGSSVHAAEWDLVADALPEIRVEDGIHHTDEGQRLYAQLVADSVRARCTPVDPDVVAANGRYVDATHETFLGRAPTSTEREVWVGRLTFGFPRTAFTRTFATSTEWLDGQIDGLYQQALGRPADAEGRAYWRALLRSGTPLSAVMVEVFASDERWARSGGTATGYVTGLYRTLLHRDPDAAGLRHWSAVLAAGAPRRVVAGDFHASLESRRDRVGALYTRVLGRQPDPVGLDHWADALLVIDDVRIAAVLAASEEFFVLSQR